MTVDETWVHYYEPENEAQWVGPGSRGQRSTRRNHLAGKVMATVFWDAKGVIMLDLLTQEKYNNWSVLCKLARPAENRHQ